MAAFPSSTAAPVRRGSAFFPSATNALPNNTRMNPLPPSQSIKENTLRRMNSDEALSLAMTLSEQESRHGVNMYDSLQSVDEPEIQGLMNRGFCMEDAVLEVFNQKVSKGTLRRVPSGSVSAVLHSGGSGPPSPHGNPYAHNVRPGDQNYIDVSNVF
jgi:hypothetical protein